MTGTAIIVERTIAGTAFAVTPRPRRRELERAFPLAWQALEHAELLAYELSAAVVDRTEAA